MIVVLGSRHDKVATKLVATWPTARLCDAADLMASGWVWQQDGPRYWVIGGERVDDRKLTGVFVRRQTVYPEELVTVHPEDRSYLAAESHSFLVFVLATTGATVMNPVVDGATGDEAIRPERWMSLAVECGLRLAPLRLRSSPAPRHRPLSLRRIDIVGGVPWGEGPLSATCRNNAAELVERLGLGWASCIFDGKNRLVAVTTASEPCAAATIALEQMLRGPT